LLLPQTKQKLGTTRDNYQKTKGPGGTEHITPKKGLQSRYIGKEERYTQLYHHHHLLSIA
jgi:hypothetical protein